MKEDNKKNFYITEYSLPYKTGDTFPSLVRYNQDPSPTFVDKIYEIVVKIYLSNFLNVLFRGGSK